MPDLAPQIRTIGLSEVRNIAIDVRGKLDTGETLSGTPTITEVTTTDFAISGAKISTAALVIDGLTVPIGQAVQFVIDASGATINSTYYVKFVCGTDAPQTISGMITVKTN